MDFQESDGMENAARRVAHLLQRPEHLEKVDQLRRKFTRQKAAVDARLKTAVQTQLDDVKTGLNKLKSALEEVQEIKGSMSDIDAQYGSCQELERHIKQIRDAHWQHSQLAAAVDHLKHIYTVPTVVTEANEMIQNSNLLAAHQKLHELENTRDELLYQMHKSSEDTADVRSVNQPLLRYFEPVKELSSTLGAQMWFILQRLLHTVRNSPALAVTTFRIIEREERADAYAEERRKNSGFQSPDRPKNWREKALSTIDNAVMNRFEGVQMETRDIDKAWLGRYLMDLRKIVVEDLVVVKNLAVPLFPPQYEIFDRYVNMYHKTLTSVMEDVGGQRMEPGEIITLLCWLKQYPEMMLADELTVDVSSFDPLISPRYVKELEEQYLHLIQGTVSDWMKRMIEAEVKDWWRTTEPRSNVDKHYHTDMPVLLGQMISQNLDLVQETSIDLRVKVMELFVTMLHEFQEKYEAEIIKFKNKYIAEGRREPVYFLQYMIATVNNCFQLKEYTGRLQDQALAIAETAPMSARLEEMFAELFEECKKRFEIIADGTLDMLCDIVFIDLDMFLADLLTKKWIGSSKAMDTIDATVRDYAADFKSLRPQYFSTLMNALQKRLVKEYVKALTTRRSVFKSQDDRKKAAAQIKGEGNKVADLFLGLHSLSKPASMKVLGLIAEVIGVKDTDMLDFEIQELVRKNTDMKAEHLMAILSMRGDVNKSQAKQIVARTPLAEETDSTSADGTATSASGALSNAGGYFSDLILT
ncbi:exocyst complex component 3-like [Sycon ciliatum]|uniref:exocyst complex component 3-like n=1 Tax=Sycon ciliatum TaxID=27933 RepID=UPI0020A8B3BA|eukprot:scpid48037/ scgid28436/ Exocyst complex component 3; Exocyst complex component Sec6